MLQNFMKTCIPDGRFFPAHRAGATTSASATSHIYHRNVDWRMVARLGVSGVLGAILGAWILSNMIHSARTTSPITRKSFGLFVDTSHLKGQTAT
jgi:hypothetical protein